MSLLTPAWLLLAAVSLVVLILHVRRPRTFEMPSIQLWRMLGSGSPTRQRLRLPPPNILLLLQLLIIALIALALARPLTGSRFAHEIVVLDASGSMRGRDVVPSRFDAAVAHLAAMVAGPIGESGARVSVVLAGARPQLIVARLEEPEGLAPSLQRLQAGDGDADWAQVIRLASSVIKDGETTRLVLITDDAAPGVARLSAALPGVTVEARLVAGAAVPNAGLRANLRAVDASAGKWRAEGSVAFSRGFTGEVTVTALVQPEGSDGFLEWGSVDVRPPPATAPDGTTETPFGLDLDLRMPGAVALRLPDDSGPHDNAVQFVVHPKPRALRILQLGTVSEPLMRALAAAAEVKLYTVNALPADTATFDLVVVNGVEVVRHPRTNVLWLGSAHASGETGGEVRAAAETILWRTDHPLSRSVSWSLIKPGRAYGFSRLQDAATILEAGAVPLVEARTTLIGREVRVAFDLDSSNWPDQPSFPIFVSNLLHWIAPDLGQTVEMPCIVGASCAIDARLLGAESLLVAPGAGRSDAANAKQLFATTLPASSPAGILPQGYEEQFIPDRAGLYRFTRDSLTRFVAVNALKGARAIVPPAGSDPIVSAASPVEHPPAWWLLAAVFLLLASEGWLAGRGAERFLWRMALARGNPLAPRRRLLLAARIAALAFVALALAGVPLLFPGRSSNVVVVSGPTLEPVLRSPGLMERIGVAADGDRAGETRLGFVAIGARSRIAGDLGAAPSRNVPAARSAVPVAADLEQALALAAAMLPADAPGRIVVAFDGNETRGNAARVLPGVVERGVKIDVLPITHVAAGEVLVEEVAVPERIFAGDPFPLHAVVYSHGRSDATVQILRDGEVIVERPIELVGGRSRLETVIPAAAAGRARYEVIVNSPGDTFAQNNRNGVVVDVLPAAQVLIVAAQPAWAAVFAKALEVHEIKTKIVEPKRAPFYLKDWLAYSGIVLMNVPAIDLVTLQQELIEKAVADHGRGLLLLGGENSFGPGGYYQTPLERVSPLSSRVPRDAQRVALVFVLDRSGSMQRDEGGATRLDIAKQATASAIRLLHQESLIAIVVFDSEAKVLLPLRPAKDAEAAQVLQQIEPGGGTSIHPALVEALRQLDGVDAMVKHIVVMSDGLTQPGDFPGILKAISDQGISVSTVSIGEGADGAMLQEIARLGKGAFHATRDFKALPGILSQEALLLSGKPVEERSATPAWVERNAEFFAGLPDRMPPISGYVLTTRKPQADLHLVVLDEKQEAVPLMASWRYGNGRVVALTTQGAGAWVTAWQAMAEYPLLWSQILRHVVPGTGEGLFPRLSRHGDDVEVTVDALSQEGKPREQLVASLAEPGPASEATPLPLADVSPGRYHGSFKLDRSGEFLLRVAAAQVTAETPLLVSYPAIYDFLRADPHRMVALAAATGGRVLTSEDQVFARGVQRWIAHPAWQVWTMIALGFFLIDLIIRYVPRPLGARRRGRDTI